MNADFQLQCCGASFSVYVLYRLMRPLPLACCTIINPRRAHALARVTVVGLSVFLSGLNLLLQKSRATRYYTYVFFTRNARFNMCGVR